MEWCLCIAKQNYYAFYAAYSVCMHTYMHHIQYSMLPWWQTLSIHNLHFSTYKHIIVHNKLSYGTAQNSVDYIFFVVLQYQKKEGKLFGVECGIHKHTFMHCGKTHYGNYAEICSNIVFCVCNAWLTNDTRKEVFWKINEHIEDVNLCVCKEKNCFTFNECTAITYVYTLYILPHAGFLHSKKKIMRKMRGCMKNVCKSPPFSIFKLFSVFLSLAHFFSINNLQG